MAVRFKGARFPKDIILHGGTLVRRVSLELSPYRPSENDAVTSGKVHL